MKHASIQENKVQASQLMKILANENRITVFNMIAVQEHSVASLEKATTLSQSALSQHLAKMRKLGVVTTRRDAQTIYYKLSSPSVQHLLDTLGTIFDKTDISVAA